MFFSSKFHLKCVTHETMHTKKRLYGDLGEEFACKDLVERGFEIIHRNYNKYSGEIDIVSGENNTIHFIEVKTTFISRNTVSREKAIRPEEHVTKSKIMKIERTALSFLEEKGIEHMPWCIDVMAVYIYLKDTNWNKNEKKGDYDLKIIFLPNIY